VGVAFVVAFQVLDFVSRKPGQGVVLGLAAQYAGAVVALDHSVIAVVADQDVAGLEVAFCGEHAAGGDLDGGVLYSGLLAGLYLVLGGLLDVEVEEAVCGQVELEMQCLLVVFGDLQYFIASVVVLDSVGGDVGGGEDAEELGLCHEEVVFQGHARLQELLAVFLVEADLASPLGLVSAPDCQDVLGQLGLGVHLLVEAQQLVAGGVGGEPVDGDHVLVGWLLLGLQDDLAVSELAVFGVVLEELAGLLLDVVVLPGTVAEGLDKLEGLDFLCHLVIAFLYLGPGLDQDDLPGFVVAESPDWLQIAPVDGYPVVHRNGLESAIHVGCEYVLATFRPSLSDEQPFVVNGVEEP